MKELIKKRTSELTVDDVAMYCQENGITIGNMCYRLNELMNALKSQYDSDGDWVRDIPDNNVRLKAVMFGFELMKLVSNKDIKVSGVIEHRQIPAEDIPKLQEVARELAQLKVGWESNTAQQGQNIDADFRVL